MAYFNGSKDFLLALRGEKGEKGDNGETTQWYTGKLATSGASGVLLGATIPSGSVNVGDMYLNEETGDVYRCTTGGEWFEALWFRRTNIKGAQGEQGPEGPEGPQGNTGESAQWYTGKLATSGTSGNLHGSTIPSGSVNVGDMYLNEDTGDVYRCTTGGEWFVSQWWRIANIKGVQGPVGPEGPQGPQGGTGESTQWYTGKLTTVSTSGPLVGATIPSGSVTIGDMYLNTETGDVYRCTTEGEWTVAQWRRVANIMGVQGPVGPEGPQGPQGETAELDDSLSDHTKAANAGAVGDALKEKATKADLAEYVTELRDEVIKAVLSAEEMDDILSENPDRVLGKHFMYIGETTNKYKKGGVYKLTEEIMD